MAQRNYEDLNPTDIPSTVPALTKADNGHAVNTGCSHNPFTSLVDQKQVPQLLCFPMASLW